MLKLNTTEIGMFGSVLAHRYRVARGKSLSVKGGLSMESQPPNPEFRNNPEKFTPKLILYRCGLKVGFLDFHFLMIIIVFLLTTVGVNGGLTRRINNSFQFKF